MHFDAACGAGLTGLLAAAASPDPMSGVLFRSIVMKSIAMLATLAFLPLLAACNTMEGAGQDIQAGGAKLEKSADKHKHY